MGCPPGSPQDDDRRRPDRPLSPYPALVDANVFVQGATVDLTGTRPADLPGLLEAMRARHHINTISVYGLEGWDPPGQSRKKDRLFAELTRVGMMIVVRLEAYDARSFAFRPADVEPVVAAHDALLRYLSAPQRRNRIAYVQLNMPLDDPAVQERLGGVNSALSIGRQASYAVALVRRVRAALAGAPVYIGVFYGWDNTYRPPSYAPAHPDGYVLTNYSYPAGEVPDRTADAGTLINEPRLRVAADRAVAQYGDRVPLIVEYGFHTAARHRAGPPAQRAGLVADTAAKHRALLATTRLYCDRYPHVRGTVYFGFNIVKAEGDPPALLDFALQAPPTRAAAATPAAGPGGAGAPPGSPP